MKPQRLQQTRPLPSGTNETDHFDWLAIVALSPDDSDLRNMYMVRRGETDQVARHSGIAAHDRDPRQSVAEPSCGLERRPRGCSTHRAQARLESKRRIASGRPVRASGNRSPCRPRGRASRDRRRGRGRAAGSHRRAGGALGCIIRKFVDRRRGARSWVRAGRPAVIACKQTATVSQRLPGAQRFSTLQSRPRWHGHRAGRGG